LELHRKRCHNHNRCRSQRRNRYHSHCRKRYRKEQHSLEHKCHKEQHSLVQRSLELSSSYVLCGNVICSNDELQR
jgi:hypothetical protein